MLRGCFDLICCVMVFYCWWFGIGFAAGCCFCFCVYFNLVGFGLVVRALRFGGCVGLRLVCLVCYLTLGLLVWFVLHGCWVGWGAILVCVLDWLT